LAIGGVCRGVLEHKKNEAVAQILGVLTGVSHTPARTFSARAGHLVVRVVMALRRVSSPHT